VNGFLGLLRHRDYRLLVSGATVSSLGGSIAPVALAFAVLDLGGSATDLGLVVAAYALAEVVTVLFGGVLGDRVPRQVMMQGSSAAAFLTQGVVAVALVGGWASIPMLTVIGIANGCLGALAGPSSSAMTRQTVPPADLATAVAGRRLCQNAAQVVGFSVAGVLVAAFGSGWAIAVDAATYGVAAVCFGLIRVAAMPAPETRTSMLSDLGVGAAEVFRHTWLWLLIGQALLYHLFFGGVLGVLGPIVVGDSFGRAAWGWALGALMTGFIVGGLVSLRWRPRHGLYAGTALLSLTAAFPFAMALGSSGSAYLWPLLLGAFLHGFGLELFSVNWDLSIQQNVAEDKLARVYSFDLVGSFVARPLGLVLTGPVAAAVGFDRWLVVVGIVMAGSSLLALLSPAVRHLERRSDLAGDVAGDEVGAS
jgi:MFS family permease